MIHITIDKKKVTIQTSTPQKVTFELTDEHLKYTVEEYIERLIKPALLALNLNVFKI